MKNISLKLDDEILKETEYILKMVKKSRNGYINEAVNYYNQHQKRKLLKEQLKKESAIVAEDSMHVLQEFDQMKDA